MPTGGRGRPDRFEPNYDFNHATVIKVGERYNLNFVPGPGESEDNDFFKVWVKPGMILTCETFDLGPGVDTNIIIYDQHGNGLAGNDDVDVARADLSSRVVVQAAYTGWLYILVGQGRPAEGPDPSYGLHCYGGAPTPTPRPTAQIAPFQIIWATLVALTPSPTSPPTVTPLPTPTPFPPTWTPVPTSVPASIAMPTPPSTPAPTPASTPTPSSTPAPTGGSSTGWVGLALLSVIATLVLAAFRQTGVLSLFVKSGVATLRERAAALLKKRG